jgi:hypothetical protein
VRFLKKQKKQCLSHQIQLNLFANFASADSKMLCARKLLTKTQVWRDGGKEVQKGFSTLMLLLPVIKFYKSLSNECVRRDRNAHIECCQDRREKK